MSVLLPMFPLQVVVFPGERVPLHIFEERYQQLVQDCENDQLNFGIPTYLEGNMLYGTELSLEKVVTRYPNGASDIVCRGLRVFKIERFYENYPAKLYAGADVVFLDNLDDSVPSLKERTFSLVQKLYSLIGAGHMEYDEEFNSFSYAHTIGLSKQKEYELLQLPYESQRLSFIADHLKTTIPVIKEMNRTQELIQMNGHFRNYDPLDFKSFKLE